MVLLPSTIFMIIQNQSNLLFYTPDFIEEDDLIEEENTIAENELKEKVGRLKSITIDIGEEIKGHNVLLSEADNTFDRYVVFGAIYYRY